MSSIYGEQMLEYIEREHTLKLAKHIADMHSPTGLAAPLIISAIENAPKADVVEVVRCKDCVFSRELDKYEKKLYIDNCVGCTYHSKSYHSLIMEDNDFCSYKKRKEGAR